MILSCTVRLHSPPKTFCLPSRGRVCVSYCPAFSAGSVVEPWRYRACIRGDGRALECSDVQPSGKVRCSSAQPEPPQPTFLVYQLAIPWSSSFHIHVANREPPHGRCSLKSPRALRNPFGRSEIEAEAAGESGICRVPSHNSPLPLTGARGPHRTASPSDLCECNRTAGGDFPDIEGLIEVIKGEPKKTRD